MAVRDFLTGAARGSAAAIEGGALRETWRGRAPRGATGPNTEPGMSLAEFMPSAAEENAAGGGILSDLNSLPALSSGANQSGANPPVVSGTGVETQALGSRGTDLALPPPMQNGQGVEDTRGATSRQRDEALRRSRQSFGGRILSDVGGVLGLGGEDEPYTGSISDRKLTNDLMGSGYSSKEAKQALAFRQKSDQYADLQRQGFTREEARKLVNQRAAREQGPPRQAKSKWTKDLTEVEDRWKQMADDTAKSLADYNSNFAGRLGPSKAARDARDYARDLGAREGPSDWDPRRRDDTVDDTAAPPGESPWERAQRLSAERVIARAGGLITNQQDLEAELARAKGEFKTVLTEADQALAERKGLTTDAPVDSTGVSVDPVVVDPGQGGAQSDDPAEGVTTGADDPSLGVTTGAGPDTLAQTAAAESTLVDPTQGRLLLKHPSGWHGPEYATEDDLPAKGVTTGATTANVEAYTNIDGPVTRPPTDRTEVNTPMADKVRNDKENETGLRRGQRGLDDPYSGTSLDPQTYRYGRETYPRNQPFTVDPDTLGGRLNNLGMIKWPEYTPPGWTPTGVYEGGKKGERGFVEYKTAKHGHDAIGTQIGFDVDRGRTTGDPKLLGTPHTLDSFVNKWAPKEDNNPTDEYVKFVADKLGVSGDVLLKDVDREALQRAIAEFESRTKFGGDADQGATRSLSPRRGAGQEGPTRPGVTTGETQREYEEARRRRGVPLHPDEPGRSPADKSPSASGALERPGVDFPMPPPPRRDAVSRPSDDISVTGYGSDDPDLDIDDPDFGPMTNLKKESSLRPTRPSVPIGEQGWSMWGSDDPDLDIDDPDFGDPAAPPPKVTRRRSAVNMHFEGDAFPNWNRNNPGEINQDALRGSIYDFDEMSTEDQELALAQAEEAFLGTKVSGGRMSQVGRRMRKYFQAMKHGDKKAQKKALKEVEKWAPRPKDARKLAEARWAAMVRTRAISQAQLK